MLPLQGLDLSTISPLALVLFVYVGGATIWWHLRTPDTELAWWKGILLDTAEALLIILCMAGLQWAVHHTLDSNYAVGGVRLHDILDYSHLAVLFRWMFKCLLRMLPPRRHG